MRIELVAKRSTWLRSSALLVVLAVYFGYGAATTASAAGRVFFALLVAFNGVLVVSNARKWLATRASGVRVAEWDGSTLTLPSLTAPETRIAKDEIAVCTIASMRNTMMIAVSSKDRRTAVLTSSDWQLEGLARLAAVLRDAGVVTKES